MKSNFSLRMGYWVTTLLVALVFFITGIGNLIPVEHISRDMATLGYPPYFHKILGAWKILGAFAILSPMKKYPIKEWAYAGMFFDLTGAAASRFFTNDSFISILIPLCISVLVLLSWYLNRLMHPLQTKTHQ